jgi:hypothetical protein
MEFSQTLLATSTKDRGSRIKSMAITAESIGSKAILNTEVNILTDKDMVLRGYFQSMAMWYTKEVG